MFLARRWLRVVFSLALLAVVACGGGASVGREVPDEGGGHVPQGTNVQYRNDPPASGKHWEVTMPYGVFGQPVPEEVWVHNLEHGAIVVLYRCPEDRPICPEVTDQLQSAYNEAPPGKYGAVKMVVAPHRTLKSRVAAIAWNRMLELDTVDKEKLLQFYRAYVDKGPEDVP